MKENQQKETKFSSRSPLTSVKRRLEEIKIEAKESEINNIYNCCGESYDRRCLSFVTQVLIGLMVIIFCIVQLCTLEAHEDKEIYLILLSSTVAIFMPSPRITK
jgi:hypothetical protein